MDSSMTKPELCSVCRLPVECFCQWCQKKTKRHTHLPDDKRRLCPDCRTRQANRGGG